MDNKKVNNEFDSTNIVMFFIRWWKHLGIISFTAAVLGVIFSSPIFITPLFESTVLMFPAKSSSLSRAVFGTNVDFLEYGDVDDAERLLQVLGSTAIRDKVVERFDLFEHYDIEEDDKYRNTNLRKIYNSNISSRRTPYGAVEVRVRDKSPEMAADMANEIAALADTIQNDIRQQRALLAYQVARQSYQNMLNEINITRDSLANLMNLGIYQYNAQAEMLTQQLAIDLSRGNDPGVQAIEEQLDAIREYGGSFMTQKEHLEQTSRNLHVVQRVMQEARADLDNFVSFKFLIDDAFIAEKKVYPTRWLIVFLSAFAAGVMGILALMTYEHLSNRGIISTRKK